MRIGYICDAGNAVGWGHVGRGRSLLEGAVVESALIVEHGSMEVAAWAQREGATFRVQPWHAPSQPVELPSVDFEVLVVDHYGLDGNWIADAASQGPVFVLDDWMRSEIRATGLINPNVGASVADYEKLDVQQALTGAAFALLRTAVRLGRQVPMNGHDRTDVLLTLGGSDPNGQTACVADAFTDTSWYRSGGKLTIVLGSSYRGARPWSTWPSSRLEGLEVVEQPSDFVRRCRAASLVVCGASTTTYELAYLGTPFWPVALVDNQVRVAEGWRKLGVGEGLRSDTPDWLTRLSLRVPALVADPEARAGLVRAANVVDGGGYQRILAACAKAFTEIHS